MKDELTIPPWELQKPAGSRQRMSPLADAIKCLMDADVKRESDAARARVSNYTNEKRDELMAHAKKMIASGR